MSNNTNQKLAMQLINDVYVNMRVLSFSLDHAEDRDHRDFIDRMKLQKELFIKELCRIYNIDVDEHNERHKVSIENSVEEILGGIGHPSNREVIDLLIDRATVLKEMYSDILFNKTNSEVAKMILRNHIKEVNRDQKILRDYLENLMSA